MWPIAIRSGSRACANASRSRAPDAITRHDLELLWLENDKTVVFITPSIEQATGLSDRERVTHARKDLRRDRDLAATSGRRPSVRAISLNSSGERPGPRSPSGSHGRNRPASPRALKTMSGSRRSRSKALRCSAMSGARPSMAASIGAMRSDGFVGMAFVPNASNVGDCHEYKQTRAAEVARTSAVGAALDVG